MTSFNPSTFLGNGQWKVVNKWKTVISIVYFIITLSLLTFAFLGNAQWKTAKQMENSDFYSIFHNSTAITSLFEKFYMLPGIHYEYGVKCLS